MRSGRRQSTKPISPKWGFTVIGVGILALAATPASNKNASLTPASITAAVEDELLADQAVIAAAIDVRTIDGIATLSGTVAHFDRWSATGAARVSGTSGRRG